MIHAYDKVYLDKARTSLGRMLDFAVYDLGCTLTEIFGLFISSGMSERFGGGDFTLIAGRSGVELAYDIIEKSGIEIERIEPRYTVERSAEYWTGWALAYYQWETSIPFSQIVEYIPVAEIMALYTPYHEMDIRQFCDKMNELYKAAGCDSRLKELRKRAGLTQRALSELSGVPLRTIQQYEQGQKNINKANAEYLVMLSQILFCDVADFMENIR